VFDDHRRCGDVGWVFARFVILFCEERGSVGQPGGITFQSTNFPG
jgi:hypothetical protein